MLVFDFGSGTLDVSVLTVKDQKTFEVKSTSGDNHLGGQDLDMKLVNHIISLFKEKTSVDLKGNKRAVHRLRWECEAAKKTLSVTESADIVVENITADQNIVETVTRAQFESLCDSYLRLILKPVEEAIRLSGLTKKEIHQVIMVGGSSKIPKVQKMVSDFFGGKALKTDIDPDEAIALGAARLAASPDGVEDAIVLIERTSLSFGVSVGWVGKNHIVVHRGTVLPAKGILVGLSSLKENQTSMGFTIVQGDRPMAVNNFQIGRLILQIEARNGTRLQDQPHHRSPIRWQPPIDN